MTGPQFHEFLIRAGNDRLLTDREDFGIVDRVNFVEFTREKYRRRRAAHESGDDYEYWRWYNRVQHGARRAPLELIAHVVENDLPYTEILTADYIMANPPAVAAYGAPTHHFEDPTDFDEFRPSSIDAYYREGEIFEVEYDPVIEADLIIDPGTLSTAYPHAGILNATMFLRRYPTTATNRNRARSRWTYYHFLGLDIEKSASRTTDPDALADTNNPTMFNPACTVCHRVMDPVAGAFQNYGDEGFYKDQPGGVDSLDDLYKHAVGPTQDIRAASWRDRDTLSWPVGLTTGTETLGIVFANPFYDEDTEDQGQVYLDRLRVTDAAGGVLLGLEFEDLDPPIGDWGGPCGEARHNPATGRRDALWFHWGETQCAIFVDVDAPGDGIYKVEIVAWAEPHEQHPDGGLARLAPSGDCNQPSGDVYAMWCPGSVEVSIDIPVAGSYQIDVVASAEQAGDEYPRLEVTVESDSQDSAGANAIRSKLVELHEKLLGVRVTPRSPDVEAAFRLFVEVWERKRSEDTETDFRSL